MGGVKVFYYFRGTMDSVSAARLIKKLSKLTGSANEDGWLGTMRGYLYYTDADRYAINACKEETTLGQMLIRFGKNIGDE